MMDRFGKVEHPPPDELCIVCDLTFESHRYATPSGFTARGTNLEGHDWTPRIGKPVRHPRFARGSEWERQNADRKRA